MFFFGWGRRIVTKKLSDKKTLILNYGYFDIFFIFSVTFNYKYQQGTLTKPGWHYKALTKQQADKLMGGQALVPHWWRRFSLAGLFCFIILCAIIGSLGR